MKSSPFYLSVLLLLSQLLSFGQGRPVSSRSAGGRSGIDANTAEIFNRYVRQAQLLWRTPGLSIVVVKDDQVVFRKGYGVLEAGKPEPFTTASLGLCASTTKAMTAVCMGMLVDSGKVKWTDKVRDIYPEFSLSDPGVTDELTVRDLFTHNVGLGNADNLWVYGFSREEILHRMQLVPMAYSLRSSFIYQNLMYIVAGELIHRLSGLTWEDFITQNLFRPLGMEHTYALYTLSLGKGAHEIPHFLIGDSIRPIVNKVYDNVGPAGGVWSCADDMDKWMRFLLDSAAVKGQRLLTTATYRELFKPQAIVPEGEFYPTMQLTRPNWTTYGLGWFQEDYRGKMVQFHTGSLDGAVAILGLLPSSHFGIYIFGNLDHTELRHALMYKAMDLWAFPDANRDWSTEMYAMYKRIREEGRTREKEKEARRVTGTLPSVPLAAYTGNYTNEIYGNATVVLSGDSLSIRFPNNIRMALQHWNYDTFIGIYDYFWWDKDWIQFSLDTGGKPVRFEREGVVYTLQPAGKDLTVNK